MTALVPKVFKMTMVLSALFGSFCAGNYVIHIHQDSKERQQAEKYIKLLKTLKILPTRTENLNLLKSGQVFDLLIIGGGATGSGIALDATTRGLKVALVEKEDFACGTSSRSTKLIHGGVRYLEKAFWNLDYGQYKLVDEACEERYHLLQNAPHLTHQIPIMVPLYSWWKIPYYWAGAKAYDLVAGRFRIEGSYFLSKTKASMEFPMLKTDKLKGAIVYYDGQQNDVRTNVALACTAAHYGATVANHVEVLEIVKDSNNKITGAIVRDTMTDEKWQVNAKGVINATGAYADYIRKMDDKNTPNIIVPSSGVHVVLPNYYSPRHMGLLDPATSDGRVIFFLPWQNNTLAGTTDAPVELTNRPKPKEEEIEFILKEIQNYLSPDLHVQRGDVLAAWSGIRPLVKDIRSLNTQSLSRSHEIVLSESGLLSICGGKWTTYRNMSEETVDAAIKQFNLTPDIDKCVTKYVKLLGAENFTATLVIKLIQKFGIDKRVADHLVSSYGDRVFEVAKLSTPSGKRWPKIGNRLSPVYFFLDGEVRYAIRNEYAITAVDMIARRTPLAFLNATATLDALPMILDIMAKELGWDEKRKKQEKLEAEEFLLTMGLGEGGLTQGVPK